VASAVAALWATAGAAEGVLGESESGRGERPACASRTAWWRRPVHGPPPAGALPPRRHSDSSRLGLAAALSPGSQPRRPCSVLRPSSRVSLPRGCGVPGQRMSAPPPAPRPPPAASSGQQPPPAHPPAPGAHPGGPCAAPRRVFSFSPSRAPRGWEVPPPLASETATMAQTMQGRFPSRCAAR